MTEYSNGRKVKQSKWLFVAASIGLSAVSIFLGLSFGSVSVSFKEIISALLAGPGLETDDIAYTILWTLRFPRVLLALIEGASLGVAGAAMQGLFRNPMADPYVLGVSSGASLGAVLGIVFGFGKVLGLWSLPILAFAGAFLSTGIVYLLSTKNGRTDTWTLLLAGIAVSSLISSIIAFLMVLFRQRVEEIVFWTMGGLGRTSWKVVGAALPYALFGSAVLWFQSMALNAFSFGEEAAFHMGVPVETVKRRILWGSSIATASCVAFTGPIGFIGLIVPHVVRILIGPDHRWLIPASALVGGNALILADLLARTIVPPLEIPVGVITSLCGAPFFLYLLAKTRKGGM
ncbi:MAG TPA: iron ABC transporter permease [Bacillota bacterium]|jgi:iron complex transport system permease protein|nr:iron ABC transporter permease [Candidatus Fermentithermobacillaceae bacterium]HOB29806.1 iron ABC transporter permease [Bacillota bacterium]HOK64952.1 iron ABC transporter permease [Bacillota bacterium]HOL12530.1 iron ABC transporter permease [Bacillota bacterium]HOQ02692.1 iron ABC transporter permease [Bacillota bacterium]